jgi:ATP-dependent helicase/nuclease subunit A
VLRREMPGRVDLWPALGEEDKDEPPPWHSPADRPAPRRAQARCARLVAERVAALIASERLPMALADGGWGSRPVGPGDVLILVQRRDRLFDAIIRELKGQGLDVAGADRLRLRAELAVRDLEAVLRVLALPEDDLSLAAALRSPLFDWSERDLYALAQPRPEGQTLWQALCAAPRQGPVARALDILEDLRDQVEFLRPFELADRLLLRHRGRERLLARLGPEAEDALDAFLAQTLAYEAAEVPSLTGFLEWRDRGEAEVKRRPDAAGRRIRVMTVHGAKGLEAPIVILPDSALRARAPARAPLIATEAGLLWTCPKGERPRAIAAAEAQREALEAEERRRLLYVAMTRAEAWLIVCAAGKVETKGEGGEECWHAAVRRGLQALGARAHDFGEGLGEGLRHEPDGWQRAPVAQPAAPGHAPPQPEVPDGSPPPPPARPAALTPSGLGGAKTLPGEADPGDATALARGRLLHLALEHLPALPPEGRGADLLALLEAAEDAPAAGGREVLADLVLQAETLVAAPHLAPLWAPATLAEVVLAAELPRLGRLRGAVDRLIVAPDAVTAVDFKTNRLVPARPEEVPEGLLRQMGAYVAMLRAVYPDREARAAILWTRGARLMELPGDLLAAALSRATPAVA